MIFLVKRNPYKTSYLWLLPGWGSIQVIMESYQYLSSTPAWLNAPTQHPHHPTQQWHPAMAPQHGSQPWHHTLRQPTMAMVMVWNKGRSVGPFRVSFKAIKGCSFVLYRHCRIYCKWFHVVPAPCIILLPAHQGIPKILWKYLWIPGRPSERVLVEDVVVFLPSIHIAQELSKSETQWLSYFFSSRGRRDQVVHDLICMQYLYVMFVHF